MFPNHPLFVDKLLQSRQDEIERELSDPSTYDLRQTASFPARLKRKANVLVPLGVLLVLAWWLHVLL